MMSVIPKEFYPWNTWKVEDRKEASRLFYSNEPKYIIDQTTGQPYWNESRIVVSIKCLGLVLVTPFIHTALSLIHIAYRMIKLLSFSHFWWPKDQRYDFSARLNWVKEDLKHIVIQPIVLLGIELSAIYGVFNPYDGRKLYASFEREFYAQLIGRFFIMAPCFQPNPEIHLFGGNPNKRNVF